MIGTSRPDFPTVVEQLGPSPARRPRVVIAVPVKDEEDRIGLCLESLAAQDGVDLADVAAILLLNNCTDATAERVRAHAAAARFPLHLHIADLPPPYANAGWARRLAMDAALDLVRDDGVILTTDADTVVDTHWIEANLRELGRGVEAVAGYVMANPMELMELDPGILERGALEWEYQQLAAELVARADPEPHDAWPRHNQNCGASVAITAVAYRRIGGLPPKPVGEDRALFEAIVRSDGKVRHSLEVQVLTSARTDGRAQGGLSDAIRLRGDPDHPCDEALEVAVATLRRAQWRGELRRLWNAGRIEGQARAWARKLRITPDAFRAATQQLCFGQAWAELEALSPRLVRRLVTGAELKRELRRIKRLVAGARAQERLAAGAAQRQARRAVAL
jgi:hypothetical protein